MNYIHTTQTAITNVKKAAKRTSKQNPNLKLHAALDAEAIKIGYVDFRHLNSCFKDSPELEMGSFPKLPDEYAEWFDQFNAQCSDKTMSLIRESVVFAFDIKNCQREDIGENPNFQEIQSAWDYFSRDIARSILFGKDDDGSTAFETYDFELNIEFIQSDIEDYHYFLAVGDDAPLTPKYIRAFLDKHVFFWPDYCWYQGKCISLRF